MTGPEQRTEGPAARRGPPAATRRPRVVADRPTGGGRGTIAAAGQGLDMLVAAVPDLPVSARARPDVARPAAASPDLRLPARAVRGLAHPARAVADLAAGRSLLAPRTVTAAGAIVAGAATIVAVGEPGLDEVGVVVVRAVVGGGPDGTRLGCRGSGRRTRVTGRRLVVGGGRAVGAGLDPRCHGPTFVR